MTETSKLTKEDRKIETTTTATTTTKTATSTISLKQFGIRFRKVGVKSNNPALFPVH